MVYLNKRYSVHHTFRKRDRIHGETDCQTCTNRDLEVVRKLQGLVVLIDEVHLLNSLNYKDRGHVLEAGFYER